MWEIVVKLCILQNEKQSAILWDGKTENVALIHEP